MKKLSVALATRNEETNIEACLSSIKDLADEIVIVDEYSSDKTVEIAKSYGAKVYMYQHEAIFHVNKQRALDHATGEWILQLDADEIIPKDLGQEIRETIEADNASLFEKRTKILARHPLFARHQAIIDKRDGEIGRKTGEIVAFFIPRRNLFLGKPLIHAGVYPDPAIRLIKKGKAHFPAKDVHEIIAIDGEVSWLENDMIHNDTPTLSRYFTRLNRYTDLNASQIEKARVGKNIIGLVTYSIIKPTIVFLSLYFRHLGFLDGVRGFLWSFLSATHFPVAYFKYWTQKHTA